ncbi:MAG: bile acid:sodium symporter [Akkermansia sp.]|nr:bile acid:sodium symporter [Akkermansia sp.]
MPLRQQLASFFDVFTAGILLALGMGLVAPCQGNTAIFFDGLTNTAIILLFFLYGAKLSRQSVIKGLLNWRLQAIVLGFTFIFFPLVVPLLRPLFEPMVGAALYSGLLYVACLPSTVQSSIAFTSVAGGNIPAAVCSASVSSLLGVILTPFLVSLLFAIDAENNTAVGLDSILQICYQILLPFLLGQLSRPWLRLWVERHRALISWNDKGTIWLVVYTAFSNATAQGYWQHLHAMQLLWLVLACTLLLLLTFAATFGTSRLLGFPREDRITIVFCGSKKSLAVGAPMMLAIFGSLDNNLLLPLMVFHQVQLMLCAYLARRWSKHKP